MRNKISLIAILLSCFILFPFSAIAIPTLGVAPGDPADSSYANLSYDGFPIGLDGGQITIWYGSDSGNYVSDPSLWLLTTSGNGDSFSFAGLDFDPIDPNTLSVASYKDPVFGVNLTNTFAFTGAWAPLNTTFYSYEFGDGENKEFYSLTGILNVGEGLEIGDWMYAVREGNSVAEFSPKTTSTMATPEPASMLLLGSGLLGLAGLGRKKFFKK